jgi:hypothetical protein
VGKICTGDRSTLFKKIMSNKSDEDNGVVKAYGHLKSLKIYFRRRKSDE